MYRRDYPDIPGMFDARFSEYNRPSLYREFQNTWLISIIGNKLIVYCAYMFRIILSLITGIVATAPLVIGRQIFVYLFLHT
jgi:hypothetical protein